MSQLQPDWSGYCGETASRAQKAARKLANLSSRCRNAWLLRLARSLVEHQESLLSANQQDLTIAGELGLSSAQVDRLRLTPDRLKQLAESLEQIAQLPDPLGRILEGHVRPNGLKVQKVSVPLGVIFFIYESRPNVTIDAAALCVKSGNAVILRGGKEALHTNRALHQLIAKTLPDEGIPADAVQMVTHPDREIVGGFLAMPDHIDLVIPRGGEALIRRVSQEARMPVLKHYKGICHIYVDREANLESAEKIVLNAKCQRPGVCNAMECLLVDEPLLRTWLPGVVRKLQERGVEIRACAKSAAHLPGSKPASDQDFDTEFLDLILAVKSVAGIDEAIDHIARHGSKHTDAILTNNHHRARKFVQEVDSAAVVVNASTRFNDGYEIGLGAEIGISTDKFHARGPCGLLELTSYKYILEGEGHIRGE